MLPRFLCRPLIATLALVAALALPTMASATSKTVVRAAAAPERTVTSVSALERTINYPGSMRARAYVEHGISATSPVGDVAFSVCGPLAAPTGCASGGTPVGVPKAVVAKEAQSDAFTPPSVGWFCFRGNFLGSAVSAPSSAGANAGCFEAVTPTHTSAAPMATSITFGESTRVEVTVDSTAGTPTGQVSLSWCGGGGCGGLNGVPIGTATLSNGRVSLGFKPPHAGSYCFKASYSGSADGKFPGSEGINGPCVTVAAAPTTSKLTLSATSISYGDDVRLRAAVTSATSTPTGSAQFWICGPLPSASGCATGGGLLDFMFLTEDLTTLAQLPNSSAGIFCFRVDYNPDGDHRASSDGGCVTVNRAAPAVRMSLDHATLSYGQGSRVNAEVTAPVRTIEGRVDFWVCGPLPAPTRGCATGGSPAGWKAAGNPACQSCGFTPPAAGLYCYRVEYTGSQNVLPYSAQPDDACLTVLRVPSTTTTGLGSPRTFVYGESVTHDPPLGGGFADVRADAGTPEGKVVFSVCGPLASPAGCAAGGTEFGSSELRKLRDGRAVADMPRLTPRAIGHYCIRGEYEGGQNHVGSSGTASITCFVVGKASVFIYPGAVTKVQGQPDPAPTWELAGFAFGETAATAGVTGAPACSYRAHGQAPATYNDVVTCDGGTLSAANYQFSGWGAGDLTISVATPPDPPVGEAPGGGGDPPAGDGTTPPPVVAAATPAASGAPTARIASPTSGTYTLNAIVPTAFSCAAAVSCVDSRGNRAPGGSLNTSVLGAHRYTVTATAGDGQTGTATISYTVVAPDNRVTISSLRSVPKGGYTIKLRVPGAGRLDVSSGSASGKRVTVRQRVTVKQAGTLTVKVSSARLKKLRAAGRGKAVTIKVSVAFTPTGGDARTVGPRRVRLGAGR